MSVLSIAAAGTGWVLSRRLDTAEVGWWLVLGSGAVLCVTAAGACGWMTL